MTAIKDMAVDHAGPMKLCCTRIWTRTTKAQVGLEALKIVTAANMTVVSNLFDGAVSTVHHTSCKYKETLEQRKTSSTHE